MSRGNGQQRGRPERNLPWFWRCKSVDRDHGPALVQPYIRHSWRQHLVCYSRGCGRCENSRTIRKRFCADL